MSLYDCGIDGVPTIVDKVLDVFLLSKPTRLPNKM